MTTATAMIVTARWMPRASIATASTLSGAAAAEIGSGASGDVIGVMVLGEWRIGGDSTRVDDDRNENFTQPVGCMLFPFAPAPLSVSA